MKIAENLEVFMSKMANKDNPVMQIRESQNFAKSDEISEDSLICKIPCFKNFAEISGQNSKILNLPTREEKYHFFPSTFLSTH